MKPLVRNTFVLLAISLCLAPGSRNLWAAEPTRVAIFPFKMNAAQDLSFMQDGIVDMLTARLTWEDKVSIVPRQRTQALFDELTQPLNDISAQELGTQLNADYVLFGSLTVFGNSVSIDAKMLDVDGNTPPLTVFNQGQGMDEVIPKINVFAQEINEKVFGRALPAPRPIAPQMAQRQTAPTEDIYAHPEKVLGQAPASTPAQESSELNPDFIVSAAHRDASSFWKSRNFESYIKAVSLGDLDGDGIGECVFIGEDMLFIYRNVERRFVKVREIPGESHFRYISVDVADINDNGKAEIFVTNLNPLQDRLQSFILEWDGSDFATISKDNNWYYRVLETPTRGTVLLGQKRGLNQLFLSSVRELQWQGGDYTPVATVSVPGDMNIFSFALGDVLNNGSEQVLALSESDYLEIFTKGGSREFKSDERYGGSVNYMDTEPLTGDTGDTEKKRVYLGQRIFLKDLDKDGKNEVIVVKNHAGSSRLFQRFRHYTSAEIVSLSWDSMGLAQNWRTRKIHGYVSDYAIGDFDNDGQPELVAAVVMKKGATFLVKPKSTIISYDIDTSSN
jgi:TolB-like protein